MKSSQLLNFLCLLCKASVVPVRELSTARADRHTDRGDVCTKLVVWNPSLTHDPFFEHSILVQRRHFNILDAWHKVPHFPWFQR